MIVKMFTVYDSKVGSYMRPFCMATRGEALRSWVDVVNDPNTMFHKHPEDYTLFELAQWDDTTAQFINLPAPEAIGPALEYIKK